MSPPVRPDLPSEGHTLEGVLALQANDAIAKGADPRAVSERLTQYVQHLRAHPDIAAQGNDAIQRGADPHAVAQRFAQVVGRGAPSSPSADAQPGLGARVLSTLGQTIAHPVDALESLITAPVESLREAVFAPSVGESRVNSASTAAGRDAEGFLLVRNNRTGQVTRVAPGAETYDAAHGAVTGTQRLAAGAQTVANIAAPGLGSKAATRLGGGVLAKAAGVATAGAVAGAAYDPSDPVTGAATGALLAPLFHGAAKTTGAVLGRVGAWTLDMAGRPVESRPLMQVGPVQIGRVTGLRDRAADLIARRAAMDRAAGAGPNVSAHPSLPPLALDQFGPNVQGYAEGMANRPGPARAILERAVKGRQQQMRPAITQTFDATTGTTAEQGEAMLRQLADQHARLDAEAAARAARDAQVAASAKAAAKAKPVLPNPLDAWRQEVGGSLAGGTRELQQLTDARRANAARLYGEAQRATAGQPVQSPTLDRFLATPLGKAAAAWAERIKGNLQSPLPTVAGVDEGAVKQLVDMGVPPEKATAAATGGAQTVPDPEMVHLMKRYVAQVARLGVRDGAEGKVAAEANAALGLWGQIRNELPDVWRHADDAYAAHSRLIDAHNLGRSLTRAQLNPANPRAALKTSLDAIEQQVARMSPEEQRAFRVGAQGAVTDALHSGPRLGLRAQLADPGSPMSRRIALATGDPNAPQRLAQRLTPQRPRLAITPEPSAQLASVVGQGPPGVRVEPGAGDMVKVAARDAAGRPIGLLTLQKTGPNSAKVFTVHVDPTAQRMGIANQLYDAAEQAGFRVESGQSGLSPEGEAFVTDRAQRTQLRGFGRGLDILKTRENPGGAHPERSLAQLDEDHAVMGVPEQQGLQQGAAHAARSAFDATRGSLKSPGQMFDFHSPERARQLAHAFPSPEAASDFQRAVAAWDAAQTQANNLFGNSRTGLRGAEGSGMGVKPSTLLGGSRAVLRAIVEKATGAAQTEGRQRLEAEAARLLTSPALKLLPPEQRAAAVRAGILRALNGGRALSVVNAPAQQSP